MRTIAGETAAARASMSEILMQGYDLTTRGQLMDQASPKISWTGSDAS